MQPLICPKCSYPHAGPWTVCYICGYQVLDEKLRRLSNANAEGTSESPPDPDAPD
jgi:hypothetical protein